MILPGQTIAASEPPLVSPLRPRTRFGGVSHGVGPAGYDVQVSEDLDLGVGDFVLASTTQHFQMPDDVLGVVHDKSTWIRLGLAVHNTVVEPGWAGHLTLELKYHGPPGRRSLLHRLLRPERLRIAAGTGIAQVIFHRLEAPTSQPYGDGDKYQYQASGPQPAILR